MIVEGEAKEGLDPATVRMAEEVTSESETIRVIKFDGTEDKWHEWNAKMLAIAKSKRWNLALTEDHTIPDLPVSKEDKTMKWENEAAMMYLTLACNGKAFFYVEGKESARLAYQALQERYQPEQVQDYWEVSKAFSDCKMKSDDSDPEEWLQELEYYKSRLTRIDAKYEKSEMEMKVYVLHALPSKYSEVVTNEQRIIATSTYKEVTKAIYDFYRRTIKKEEKTMNKEQALVSETKTKSKFKKKFKGDCRRCGRQGHKASDCYSKKDTEGNEITEPVGSNTQQGSGGRFGSSQS